MHDIAPNNALNLVIARNYSFKKFYKFYAQFREITTNYDQDLALKVKLHR
jgi:hypothetical protein